MQTVCTRSGLTTQPTTICAGSRDQASIVTLHAVDDEKAAATGFTQLFDLLLCSFAGCWVCAFWSTAGRVTAYAVKLWLYCSLGATCHVNFCALPQCSMSMAYFVKYPLILLSLQSVKHLRTPFRCIRRALYDQCCRQH